MKVRLLNDGGFGDMTSLDFGTVFDAEWLKHSVTGAACDNAVTITGEQLEAAGGVKFIQENEESNRWCFGLDDVGIVEE